MRGLKPLRLCGGLIVDSEERYIDCLIGGVL